jgi:hypothetical protein
LIVRGIRHRPAAGVRLKGHGLDKYLRRTHTYSTSQSSMRNPGTD